MWTSWHYIKHKPLSTLFPLDNNFKCHFNNQKLLSKLLIFWPLNLWRVSFTCDNTHKAQIRQKQHSLTPILRRIWVWAPRIPQIRPDNRSPHKDFSQHIMWITRPPLKVLIIIKDNCCSSHCIVACILKHLLLIVFFFPLLPCNCHTSQDKVNAGKLVSSYEISLVLIKIACLIEGSTTGISANVVLHTHAHTHTKRHNNKGLS